MDRDKRIAFHALLVEATGLPENSVYFQQPSTSKMSYPCVVYKRDFAEEKRADNRLYGYTQRYMVTVIDRNPDSNLPSIIRNLPYSSFDRHYTSDQLNHDVFSIYF